MKFIYLILIICQVIEIESGNTKNITVDEWVPTQYCREITINSCPSYKCSDFDLIIKTCECQYNNLRCNDSCVDKTEQYCFNCYELVKVEKIVCLDGWTGDTCSTPICNNCKSTEYCQSPNICTCYKDVSNTCITTYCDTSKDCFPGTCVNNNCNCFFGYQLPNCQNISLRARIDECNFNIIFDDEIKNVKCSSPRLNIKNTVSLWLNKAEIKRIEGNWMIKYDSPSFQSKTDLPSYIKNSFIHVSASYYEISSAGFKQKTDCPLSSTCKNILTDRILKFENDDKIDITVKAVLSGQKTVYINGETITKKFEQTDLINKDDGFIRIGIDTDKPRHCFMDNFKCPYYPIMMKESIVNNIININLTKWIDNSGIKDILVEFFPMGSADGNFLTEFQNFENKFTLKSENITYIKYQFKRYGVYSVRLTVNDLAGNFAKARKIVLHTNSSYSVIDSAPIYLDKKNTIYDLKHKISFIHLKKFGQNKFDLNWQDRFIDSNLKEWRFPVRMDENIEIDDTEYQFGRRSINQLKKYANLLAISYAYKLTDTSEDVATAEDKDYILKQPDDSEFPVNLFLKNSSLIKIWFKLYDIFGTASKIEEFEIIMEAVDSSIISMNPQFKTQTVSQFESSLYLYVINKISGIKTINYRIIDENNITITEDNFVPIILHKHTLKRTASEGFCNEMKDDSCYCVKFFNECYFKSQEIIIDNCKFDKYADKILYIHYQVQSYSNMVTSGRLELTGVTIESVQCRGLSRNILIGIIIGSIIGFLLFILFIVFCFLYYCCPNNKYSNHFRQILADNKKRYNSKRIHISEDSENPLYMTEEEYSKAMNFNNNHQSNGRFAWTSTKLNKHLIPSNQLTIGNILKSGKFANIRNGIYTNKGQTINVVIKSVNESATKNDEDMMRKKIIFLMKLENKNVNLVEFIGSSQLNISNAPSMVLELCDCTLKDWLKSQEAMSRQTITDLFRFSTHIAIALETLHMNNVIHRKVALRNILLKKSSYGYQAKLIGYGPSSDMDPGNSNRNALVALKWLAPETLNTLDELEPIYNIQTDIWSYGITLWEIFSLGALPYANHPSAQIKVVLSSGERLECPKDCPQLLFDNCLMPCWNSDPNARPSLSKIIKEISKSTKNDKFTGYYSKNDLV